MDITVGIIHRQNDVVIFKIQIAPDALIDLSDDDGSIPLHRGLSFSHAARWCGATTGTGGVNPERDRPGRIGCGSFRVQDFPPSDKRNRKLKIENQQTTQTVSR